MTTLPNFLSLLRIPLAFAFLQNNLILRALAILAAMATDFFDGFLARRYKSQSRIGTTLDPLTDKFFVLFALASFLYEGNISPIQVICMLSRDIALFLFGSYLLFSCKWKHYEFQAIWCGKITTTLQLFVLLGLTFHLPIPFFLYLAFIVLGIFSLGELYLQKA